MIEVHLEWGNISWTKPRFAIDINTDPCIYESRAVLVDCPIVLILFLVTLMFCISEIPR